MGTIKDRNGMDLTEAEYIKKRWQEYTEELYKKILMNQITMMSVFTHLEQDILECKIKWTLESITMNKASGGDGIPLTLFVPSPVESREAPPTSSFPGFSEPP